MLVEFALGSLLLCGVDDDVWLFWFEVKIPPSLFLCGELVWCNFGSVWSAPVVPSLALIGVSLTGNISIILDPFCVLPYHAGFLAW